MLKDLPRRIEGIDKIETQIIDDGSSDKTVAVAKALGVDHIVSYVGNKGLGNAFKRGVENALGLGADILVNTDGDNQYKSSDIPRLVASIVAGQADIVIGNRSPDKIKHFSWYKRLLQKLGSRVTQYLTGIDVPDAVSGFRAYSRQALMEINITSDFSYVLDTTIQAGKKRLKLDYVDIGTNAPTRPSRLFGNIWQHIKKSSSNLLRVYAMYEPLKIFSMLGSIFIIVGALPMGRYAYFYIVGQGAGHIQSLVVGIMFIIIGVQFLGLGILGDLIAKQRKLIEDLLLKSKQAQDANYLSRPSLEEVKSEAATLEADMLASKKANRSPVAEINLKATAKPTAKPLPK